MKKLIIGIILLFTATNFLMSCSTSNNEYYIQTAEIPEDYTVEQKIELSAKVLPHPRQMLWWEDEFKGFIHYGPNTYSGREWGTGFEESVIFNPTGLDTDQWCALMSSAGITRVVMVVKHHEGYCLWQTRYTDHSVASSPWKDGKGDVLKELAESCEKYGMRLGVYLSPADLYQIESPDGYYGNGSEFTERTIPAKVEGRPFSDNREFNYVVDDYNEYFLNQLFELLTEYGPIHEVWFDGANPKPGTDQSYNYEAWYDIIRKLAPDAVIFGKGPDSRWCGNEGGRTREAEYNVIPLDMSPDNFNWPDMTADNIAGRDQITEDTKYFHYYPAETNTSIRHGWFWRNDDEQQVRSVDDVFDIYERSVGGNSQLHLNIPPNTAGKFSPRDAKVLNELGEKIRTVYSTNLLSEAKASVKNVLDNKTSTWWQAPEKEASFEITLPHSQKINRFMIMEAIEQRGERVEAHSLEAKINGAWTTLAEGRTIGHKRILRFPSVETDTLRLNITQSRLAPAIAHVSAHYYDEPPKPVQFGRNKEGMVSMGVGNNFAWRSENSADQSQKIFYTLDGTDPDIHSIKYTGPFALPLGGHLKARAIVESTQGPINEAWYGILTSEWSASDSEEMPEEAEKAIDGNYRSSWVLKSSKRNRSITIDMKKRYSVGGFTYRPAPNGFIEAFNVEISTDGIAWDKIYSGEFGNIMNDPSTRLVHFERTFNTRYIRFADLQAPGSAQYVGAAEIELLSGNEQD